MQIICDKNLNNNSISFKAKEDASIRTLVNDVTNDFTVYRVDYSDSVFLDKMCSKINLSKLTSSKAYSKIVLKTWKNIINNAVFNAKFDEPQKTFLITQNSKPCGIMSYQNIPNLYLDNIATWPVKKNVFNKGVGTSLLALLFINSKANNVKSIYLDCVKNSSINLEKFYKSFGFVKNVDRNLFDMVTRKSVIEEQCARFDKFVKIKKINGKQVDLNKVLNIDYNI